MNDAHTRVPSVSSAVGVGLRAVENDICWILRFKRTRKNKALVE
jgi:hypothetical protein